MDFQRQVTRRLHEEHEATLALWGRVPRLPIKPDADGVQLLRRAAAALAGEIGRHFRFEEEALFPRLAAAGEGEIGELLGEEHVVIRDAAARLDAALSSARFEAARAVGVELAELIFSHVQKEELSLLPAVDDALDEQADAELSAEYLTA
ncbi:MAG TPA: hemerythrin domain-containing protein [Burkholderiales bacterium]|nr:hemerythrin domain-containing protein [Burkholderiales bacterium]